MTGAPIDIGMPRAVYEGPLEPDRGQAVRERHMDQPLMPQSRSPVDCPEEAACERPESGSRWPISARSCSLS